MKNRMILLTVLTLFCGIVTCDWPFDLDSARCGLALAQQPGVPLPDGVVKLPDGVKAVWDIDKAHKQTTPTREAICINGLWQWQPADSDTSEPPTENWGWFKVPGSWPGITDYMQKDSQ
ncbi:MAG: hypothetical protein FWD31_09610, partial [Planctomycetaceae bacterium]|nr:hypothetical protein [Planctomycetaceae bacterium]